MQQQLFDPAGLMRRQLDVLQLVSRRRRRDSLSLCPKELLTVLEGEHILSGISGYDAAEMTDENPARVEAVTRLTLT